ncbi:nuclear transport factor 2 family protein, partial [Nocardia neocaledoniensis]
RAAVAAFHRAVATGDPRGLLDLLAPDVVFLGDGGGRARAALAPVVGADAVADLLRGSLPRIGATMTATAAQVNGHPAVILSRDGGIDTVFALRVDHGLISGVYAVRNPEKLARVEHETVLRR